MKTRPVSSVATVALVIGLALASPAHAQDNNNNCDPPTAEEKANSEAWTELNIRIKAYDRLVNNVCKFKHKMMRLFHIEPDPEKITNDMVLEAAKPEIDPVLARMQNVRETNAAIERMKMRKERLEDQRRNSNPAEEAVREHSEKMERERVPELVPLVPAVTGERPPAPEPVVLPPTRQGGFITVFEGRQDSASGTTTTNTTGTGINGRGTAITADGIQSGNFKDNKLQGEGEIVTADGTWRGGTFQDGELEGPGFEVRDVGERLEVVEANFKDDKPDGVVEVAYDDGTSRRDVWYKGQRAATGQLAGAGKTPVTPEFKTPEQLAAEAEAKFQNLLVAGDAPSLYTLGDGLIQKGATGKGKLALEALARRFPASPLAATAIAQLTRLEASERAAAADTQRQAQLAQQAEAARQAQIAQMQYQQQVEAQRQADEARRQQQLAQETRRREEGEALGQLAGALGQLISGGGGGSTYTPPPEPTYTPPPQPTYTPPPAPQPTYDAQNKYYPISNCIDTVTIQGGYRRAVNNCGKSVELHFSGGMVSLGNGKDWPLGSSGVVYGACEVNDGYDQARRMCRR
jgi:hypothetical protein